MGVIYRDHVLGDNRPFVKIISNEVRCGDDALDATLERLDVRVGPNKSGLVIEMANSQTSFLYVFRGCSYCTSKKRYPIKNRYPIIIIGSQIKQYGQPFILRLGNMNELGAFCESGLT